MKYRKKPVVIEAMELPVGGMNWNMTQQADIARWMVGHDMKPGTDFSISEEGWTIKTLEGDHLAQYGDFIIMGVAGEFYPCKPDIFAQTYDPA